MAKTIKVVNTITGEYFYATPTGVHASLPELRMTLSWQWEDNSLEKFPFNEGQFFYENGNLFLEFLEGEETDWYRIVPTDLPRFQELFH